MSLVAISGNASGTGTLTIAAPNTNSNYTLTLPTNTGTLISTKSAGTVLQVLQTVKTDTFTTTSTTYTDVTGISVSITPTSATSKILVFANLNASVTATDNYFAFQLVRGSTAIFNGDAASSRTVGSVGSALITGSLGVTESLGVRGTSAFGVTDLLSIWRGNNHNLSFYFHSQSIIQLGYQYCTL